MIPSNLRIELIVGLAIYFVIILFLLKNRRLNLKYTLLWLLTGLILLLMAIFPQILGGLAELLGFQSSMNLLYVLLLGLIMMILMSITSIVSGQNDRIRKMAEENALVEKRVRELEKLLNRKELFLNQGNTENDLFSDNRNLLRESNLGNKDESITDHDNI